MCHPGCLPAVLTDGGTGKAGDRNHLLDGERGLGAHGFTSLNYVNRRGKMILPWRRFPGKVFSGTNDTIANVPGLSGGGPNASLLQGSQPACQ